LKFSHGLGFAGSGLVFWVSVLGVWIWSVGFEGQGFGVRGHGFAGVGLHLSKSELAVAVCTLVQGVECGVYSV